MLDQNTQKSAAGACHQTVQYCEQVQVQQNPLLLPAAAAAMVAAAHIW
jgi:hypothetical protein